MDNPHNVSFSVQLSKADLRVEIFRRYVVMLSKHKTFGADVLQVWRRAPSIPACSISSGPGTEKMSWLSGRAYSTPAEPSQL